MLDPVHTTTTTHHAKHPLWVCLYWPMLPLIVFEGAHELPHENLMQHKTKNLKKYDEKNADTAKAVCEKINQKRRIYYANAKAQKSGVSVGMSLGSANSLCAGLESRLRDQQKEQAQLITLAQQLAKLTPYVHIDDTHLCIHLEISTCLKLHKGLNGFQQQLQQQLGRWANCAKTAIGPSPECAAVFARHYADDISFWTSPSDFWHKWYHLPVSSLLLSPDTQHALQECGLYRLSDIAELGNAQRHPTGKNQIKSQNQAPQLTSEQLAAFKRRFGATFVTYWLQLCGQKRALPEALTLDHHFDQRISLAYEAEHMKGILPAIHTLLNALETFLIKHCVSIFSFELQFKDTQYKNTNVSVQLTQPHHRAAFFQELTELQLEHQQFSAPIIEVRLYTTQCIPQHNQPLDLFDTANATDAGHTLRDRLLARLGHQSVFHLKALEDYRPENAFSQQPFEQVPPVQHSKQRKKQRKKHGQPSDAVTEQHTGYEGALKPAWLITPLPLTDINTQTQTLQTDQGDRRLLRLHNLQSTDFTRAPLTLLAENFGFQHTQTLELLQGPHTLNTGWWDDTSVQRAYYVARTPQNGLYWIFQNLLTQQWFIQGIFS